MNREELIEAVTREVLGALAAGYDICDTPEKVRHVVANGADRVSFHGEAADVPLDLAKYIDHTALKPDVTAADIDQLCNEAEEFNFASVCINPTWVKRAATNLRGSDVVTCTVIGFPLGANTTAIKAMEARRALREGAREVDMVLNVGALKSGDYELVRDDIAQVAEAAHEVGGLEGLSPLLRLVEDLEIALEGHPRPRHEALGEVPRRHRQHRAPVGGGARRARNGRALPLPQERP